MSNLARRDNGGAIDYNGDGNPDAYVHEIVTQRVSATINPKEDGAVGKLLMMSIATLISRPVNTLKEFWGWMAVVAAIYWLFLALFSSKPVVPEARNFTDHFRPENIGAGLGRTGKSWSTSIADSANASEVTPTSASLKAQTTVRVD
jgi:hypothetical protein